MKLKRIQEVLNYPVSDDMKRSAIIEIIAQDNEAISLIMQILDAERKQNKEIKAELNMLLSKAHIGLDNKKINKGDFIQKEIVAFYTKYRNVITHCFNLKL